MLDRALVHRPEGDAPAAPVNEGSDRSETIFLSPRVIDRAAFEQYAAELRALIEHAAAQTARLQHDAQAAQESTRALAEQSARAREQGEIAARLLKGLSAKSAEVDRQLERAAELAAAAQRIDPGVAASLKALVDAEVDRAARGIAAGLERQTKAAEEVRSVLQGAHEAAVRDVNDHLAPALEAISRRCDQAHHLLDEGTGGKGPGLSELVDRALGAADRAGAAAAALRDLEQQAHEQVRRAGARLDGVTAFMDQLDGARTRLVEETASALAAAEGARRELAHAASDAAQASDPLSQACATAVRAEESLVALLEQTRSAQDAEARTAQEIRLMVERLEAALAALEPWRPVLLGEGSAAGMPQPAKDLIAQVRSELAKDLAAVAQAMQDAAERAVQSPGQLSSDVLAPVQHAGTRVVVRSGAMPSVLSSAAAAPDRHESSSQ